MERRRMLVIGTVSLSVLATGCLQRQKTTKEDIVTKRHKKACSGMTDGKNTLPFDSKIYQSDTGLISDKYWNPQPEKVGNRFVLVSSLDSAKTKLKFDQFSTNDHTEAQTFIENTEFDDQALLVWNIILPVGYKLEVSGVTLPEKDSLHAYICSYDGTDPNETRATASYLYNTLLRVDVPTPPKEAKLTYSTENADYKHNAK